MDMLSNLNPETHTEKRPDLGPLFSVVKFIFAVVVLVAIINGFGLQSYEVYGQSMEPTLSPGDRLVISKLGKTYASIGSDDFVPKRGDIVVFDDPRGSSDLQLIKRVIALPGERVRLADGKFLVFNQEHPQGFNVDEALDLELEYTSGFVDVTVEEGHIFVSGDNRTPNGSLDSRNTLGTVPTDSLVGTLSVRLFPLTKARLF